MLGKRLREERERLGYNQEDFAAFADAKKRTVIDWEKGLTAPTGFQFEAFERAGADVLYILTGRREAGVLTPREAALLDNYRNATPERQRALDEIGAALPGQGAKKSAAAVPFKEK